MSAVKEPLFHIVKRDKTTFEMLSLAIRGHKAALIKMIEIYSKYL